MIILQKTAVSQKEWKEEEEFFKEFPKKYKVTQFRSANIDLLKSLFTDPARAMDFPLTIYFSLFITTLFFFSLIHSILVVLTEHFSLYEFSTLVTGCTRIFLSTTIAIMIATPGVILMWVLTPEISFVSSFKRFLFYYESVILFSLLSELFFSKFIIDSSMKIQPLIIVFAGSIAVKTLHQSLRNQPNIQITGILIVGILVFSYLQAFLIIDELIPYHLQDNIDSPITIFIKELFKIIFR